MMRIYPLTLILLRYLSLVHAFSCDTVEGTVYVPPKFALGPSEVQFEACATAYDGPKVSPINETVYDWWYFDAVSDDGLQSLVAIFFTSSFAGFPFDIVSPVTATSLIIFATFADGTSTMVFDVATGAIITTAGDGASGVWAGIGASFEGQSDLSRYDLSFTDILASITGTFSLESVRSGRQNFCVASWLTICF